MFCGCKLVEFPWFQWMWTYSRHDVPVMVETARPYVEQVGLMGWNGGGFLTDPSTRVKIDRKTKDFRQRWDVWPKTCEPGWIFLGNQGWRIKIGSHTMDRVWLSPLLTSRFLVMLNGGHIAHPVWTRLAKQFTKLLQKMRLKPWQQHSPMHHDRQWDYPKNSGKIPVASCQWPIHKAISRGHITPFISGFWSHLVGMWFNSWPFHPSIRRYQQNCQVAKIWFYLDEKK